jgi:Arc/MetJ family transcription regulator
MPPLKRTNIVLDMELVERAKELYGFRTTREAVDYALRELVGKDDVFALARALRGTGWDGDFEALRGHPLGE